MHDSVGRRLRASRRRTPWIHRLPALQPFRSLGLACALFLVGAALPAGAMAQSPTTPQGPTMTSGTTPVGGAALATMQARRVPALLGTVPPPQDLNDLPAWLEYRARNHLSGLPLEARLFYRRGLMLAHSGNRDDAVRLVRGAAELDPAFIAPHLTLASWMLPREPSQALLQYASVIDLGRQNFLLQVALLGNTLYLAFQSLFLALLAAGLILLGLRNRELRHALTERLAQFASPATARWWVWAILGVPFIAGFGLALPTVFFLGLLWPSAKLGERSVFVGLLAMLVAAPWAVGSLDHLGVPLREGQPPFHAVPLVATESPSGDRQRELASLGRRNPDNPFLQFATAWTARRNGDLTAAEAGYRRALGLWPDDDRVLNNLGNVLAMQGRTDEALEAYRRAGTMNQANAAAAFNASQIYTQRFDFRAATEALSRAAALNFDLVKTYQSLASDDGVLPLVDQWIAPRAFWAALSAERGEASGRGALPPTWRSTIETSGWGFSAVAFLLALVAVVVGTRAQRAVPLRTCNNCGAIICRRCACRRRETALCPVCAAVEARAETPDFGRVLLLQHRSQLRRRRRRLHTALAILIPGYGLLSFRRAVPAVLLLAVSAALVAVATGHGAPFSYEIRPAVPVQEISFAMQAGTWAAIYAISILGYFGSVVRADAAEAAQAAPVRSRIRLSGRDHSALAA
jgi:tetratricopeptide (TPR) repeat protein